MAAPATSRSAGTDPVRRHARAAQELGALLEAYAALLARRPDDARPRAGRRRIDVRHAIARRPDARTALDRRTRSTDSATSTMPSASRSIATASMLVLPSLRRRLRPAGARGDDARRAGGRRRTAGALPEVRRRRRHPGRSGRSRRLGGGDGRVLDDPADTAADGRGRASRGRAQFTLGRRAPRALLRRVSRGAARDGDAA